MYRKQIRVLQQNLEDLMQKQALYDAEQEAKENERVAYLNAYEAMFDGLKIVSDPNVPITLTLPMAIKPNVYYSYENNLYVGLADTIATVQNFGDVLADMNAPAV